MYCRLSVMIASIIFAGPFFIGTTYVGTSHAAELGDTPPAVSLANDVNPPVSTKRSLMDVYEAALENNADLASARASMEASQESVPQARARLLPNISGGASTNQTRSSYSRPVTDGNTYKRNKKVYYQASISQPVFDAAIWFGLTAAEAFSKGAVYKFSDTAQNLVMSTAQAYFNVLNAQDALAASYAEENAYKVEMEQSKQRYDVGLDDITSVLQAQASYDSSRANRISNEQSVQNAFQALATLTNREYAAIDGIRHDLPVVPPTPNVVQNWVDTGVQQNLSLQESNYAVQYAEENLKQSKAGHLPTVAATASYQKGDNDAMGYTNSPGRSSNGQKYSHSAQSSSVELQLSVPIYSGGSVSSQVRQSYQKLIEAEQNRESARRTAVQNIRNYFRAVNTDVETIKARLQSVISSQSSLEATQMSFDVGLSSMVDVLNAQRILYSNVNAYNNARYSYITDTLYLKRYSGTLSPADLMSLEAYLNPKYDPSKDFLPPDLAKKASAELQGNDPELGRVKMSGETMRDTDRAISGRPLPNYDTIPSTTLVNEPGIYNEAVPGNEGGRKAGDQRLTKPSGITPPVRDSQIGTDKKLGVLKDTERAMSGKALPEAVIPNSKSDSKSGAKISPNTDADNFTPNANGVRRQAGENNP